MLRVSADGLKLVGTGDDIVSTEDGSVLHQLSRYHYDARWLSDGGLVTITFEGFRFKLNIYDENFNLLISRTLDLDHSLGSFIPVAVFEYEDEYLAVLKFDTGLEVESLSK